MASRQPGDSNGTQLSRRTFLSLAAAGAASTLLDTTPAVADSRPAALMRDDYIGRLCYNENPLGPSPAAQTAMTEQIALSHRYTDWFADSLRADLATLHDVTTANVIAGNGATEILRLAAYAFSEPGTNIVAPNPSYSQFPSDVNAFGGETRYAPLDENYRVDLANITALMDDDTKAVCITNPNNPTATVLPAADLTAFADALPEGVALIIDEAYHDYVQDAGYESAMELVRNGKNVVVIRTFSKAYGLAGARIGYAVGSPAIINSIRSRQTWGTVTRPSLEGAKAALKDTPHVIASVELANQVKTYCFAEFDRLQRPYIPSETSFFMVDVGDAPAVQSALATKGIQVRTGWGMAKHIRVSVGLMPEMEDFIAALEEILTELAAAPDREFTPRQMMLFGNNPNPVRHTTRFDFQIAAPGEVELLVFDIHGRLARTIIAETRAIGRHQIDWDGTDNRGYRLASGSYFYRLRSGGAEQIRRLILI
jgi:histidinol-phosphate aminotransferase